MIKLLKECAEYIRLHPDNGLSEKLLDKIKLELSRNDGYAVVSTVSREDIISAGYVADAVSDEALDRIAESMPRGSYRVWRILGGVKRCL